MTTSIVSQAQPLEADNTLIPNNTIITPQPNNIFEIVGGVEIGTNLFHSFRQFSVPNGSTAYFNNAALIQNIFGRVTGGTISNIDGLIRANGSANLFLINPNGIIFGPNAQLNIGGSFVASTANSILFQDGTVFSATTPQTTPLLTVSIPIGLQYRSNTGHIINQSTSGLQVQPGKSLALIGGEVRLNGGVLAAPGGRVELGGLAESGTIELKVNGNDLQFNFPDNIPLTDVSLTNEARVEVLLSGGGNIDIKARNLEILDSQLLAGIKDGLGSLGTEAGDITINATGGVKVINSSIVNNVGSREINDAGEINDNVAMGNAGNINIKAESLFTDGGTLESRIFGQGNAGDLLIDANDLVSFNITTVRSNLNGETSEGNGGEVNIQARSLSLTDGAQIQVLTEGRGNAGNVTIVVGDTIKIIGVDRDGFPSAIFSVVNQGAEGNGGIININTDSLFLSNGGQLLAGTGGNGDAGNIIIHANDSVELSQNNIQNLTLITNGIGSGAEGNAGTIEIQARSLSLRGGAQISSPVFPASNDLPGGEGTGGSILIDTSESITISGVGDNGFSSGLFTSTGEGAIGQAGNITVNTGALRIADGAVINAETENIGSGGNITINADSFEAINGGQLITTSNSSGNAGSITVNARDNITLSGSEPTFGDRLVQFGPPIVSNIGANSGLFSQTTGTGTAGNITISTPQLRVLQGAQISAGSLSAQGGDITLQNIDNLQVNQSEISASTVDGVAGNLEINMAQTSLNNLELNNGSITVEATGTGNSGNLTVNASTVKLQNNSQISASTVSGEGGNISLEGLEILEVDNSSISASTETGTAGNLTVTATESIQLNNTGSLSVEAIEENGTAGNLTLETGHITIFDGAQVTVSSPEGQAGNLTINANTLSLNGGLITAETGTSEGEEGANITLKVSDLLRMENESLISATANESADGGNIDIEASFLVVFPPSGADGSDIIAKAEQGDGGSIAINAFGIFGIEENLATPGNRSNDLDASSEAGASGEILLNRELDPNRGLVKLPEKVIDPNALIAQNVCKRGSSSEFVITGRGGLPPSLNSDLNGEATEVELVEPAPINIEGQQNREKPQNSEPKQNSIVPAQGWVFNDKGEIVLVSYDPSITGSQRLRENETGCPSS
ncbi:MAG: filamentous hemagglutinin N-terminal domain-containing protein [Crocosphaera sp.]|nr:filamentous hemagglutinin N-terminal domain-containing protein [Crocosphaera sp.]